MRVCVGGECFYVLGMGVGLEYFVTVGFFQLDFTMGFLSLSLFLLFQ